jgi:hypothetical protein
MVSIYKFADFGINLHKNHSPAVFDALRCAWDVQQEIKSRNNELPEDFRMNFRI